jgi:hypothetical protein
MSIKVLHINYIKNETVMVKVSLKAAGVHFTRQRGENK